MRMMNMMVMIMNVGRGKKNHREELCVFNVESLGL